MMRPRRLSRALVGLAGVVALGAATPAQAADPIAFGKSTLAGASPERPTSLQFGPDDRLYVAQQDGAIKAYTIARAGASNYDVTAVETISLIRGMPNRNDDGAVNPSVSGRLVTGLLVTGSAGAPVIYVTSSDPRIGAGAGGSDLDLDTNSGIVSRLTRSGSSWVKQDLVRGLPRSEENHTANGLELVGSTLFVAQGGNTNAGAPSNNFAGLPEYALSAAILSIDLSHAKIVGGDTYDIPTLNAANDANDPFGGNDGLNQAKLLADGPVKVHAPGFRNPYDVVYTTAGKLYSIDNGANEGWGDVPHGEGPGGTCTNQLSEPGVTERDSLHLIAGAGYYGGHPNPTRANKSNVFGGVSPVEIAANPVECDYRRSADKDGAGNTEGSLVSFPSSTNGLTEYTASTFGGALDGDLITVSWDNTVKRLDLNASGNAATSSNLVTAAANSAGLPLDVTAQDDTDAFGGTIWYTNILSDGAGNENDGIFVLEPNTGPCNLDLSDSDGDGYSNVDENANGTDPCSAADQPPDFDQDSLSDRLDANDDNDGLADKSDPFARDAANGTATKLPLDYEWENEGPAAGGLFNLGFTGLMTNGTTDYLDQYDGGNLTAGGAGGVLTIDEVDPGDAIELSNNQKYGFQLGVDARPCVGPFTVRTRIVAPFQGIAPADFQSMGLFIGTGDQDNYVKIITGHNGGTIVQALREITGTATNTKTPLALPGPSYVDLFLEVDPVAATVQPSYTATTGGSTSARTAVGPPLTVPPTWFTGSTGLAVGILSTSIGPAPPFPATWDFIKITTAGAGTCSSPPAGSNPPPPLGGQPGGGDPDAPAADGERPVVGSAELNRTRYRSKRRPRSLAVPYGARLSFILSEDALVRFTVQKARKGRKRGRKCVDPRRAKRGARRCIRYVRVRGKTTVNATEGTNVVRFRERRKRRLAPGGYRLLLQATDAAGNRSLTERIEFRVVRRR